MNVQTVIVIVLFAGALGWLLRRYAFPAKKKDCDGSCGKCDH